MAFSFVSQSAWRLILLVTTLSLVIPSTSSEFRNLQVPFSYHSDGNLNIIEHSNGPSRPNKMKYQQGRLVKCHGSTWGSNIVNLITKFLHRAQTSQQQNGNSSTSLGSCFPVCNIEDTLASLASAWRSNVGTATEQEQCPPIVTPSMLPPIIPIFIPRESPATPPPVHGPRDCENWNGKDGK